MLQLQFNFSESGVFQERSQTTKKRQTKTIPYPMHWANAAQYLTEMRRAFKMTKAGRCIVEFLIEPLMERYENGERTIDLYEEIFAIA